MNDAIDFIRESNRIEGTRHIASEAAYRAHEMAIRRAAALARRAAAPLSEPNIENPEVQRAGAIISGAWG